ncbi:MAG TPA: NAD(P)H-dependent oxidoreductase [Chitinophagales bacterium]|nr:NAD(P)H-dependent oxidoreductase [Chitinophagales bacterium]MCB9032106.1 NAD(P)H-dependent oxidoreductase [Chitinophagales bacterium]HPE98082.1 NAD(P)H-dependent oxidoreductase [Chitinophagales bacterium]HPR30226.1 NAD(P)H-dependent oxidoreductase [Chitinophagales bacterium]HQU40342.1 NAD(P)H-dependent oxidoreductase [Chitinophagales bacterium]
MITIISATNRKDSNTLKVAKEYERLIREKGREVLLLNLESLPVSVMSAAIYEEDDVDFSAIQEQYLFPADKFIFVMPEYNGSMPGVLKMMIDVADVERAFYGKKALMVGIATGRAGNLRGMDHLTGVLNHMKMSVHYNKLPISRVTHELDAEGRLSNTTTRLVVEKQIDEFLYF